MKKVPGLAEDLAYRVFDASEVEGGGRLLFTREAGRAFRGLLEAAIEDLPTGGILFVDTRGVEMMDYSFADEAIGSVVSRAARGDYGPRHVVLLENERDLLENVGMSLWVRQETALRVEEIGGEAHVVGNLEEHLRETLDVIRAAGPITTAELAARLKLNQTACNNRATNLLERGLIKRRKETGGRRFVYEKVV